MSGKLKCIVVDDFYPTLVEIKNLCQDSSYVEVIETFSSPKKFLEVSHNMEYDLCIIDVFMPEMDGIALAKMMKHKPVIFVTDVYNKLKEAVDLVDPIDIVTKPIKKARLHRALEKAFKIVNYRPAEAKEKEYELFHTAENKGKTRLKLSEIVLVQTDGANCRNKKVFLKNGEQLTLMRCSNEKLLSLCSRLVQVNKAELVSVDSVRDFKHNEITISGPTEFGVPKKLALNRNFKQIFMDKMSY